MNYPAVLNYVESKIGVEPRRFTIFDKLSWLKQDKPEWDWESDEIKTSIEHWKNTFVNGKITWGHIIQVNELMFEKSKANCPGALLIWDDDPALFDAELFALVAEKLYELKGYSQHLDDGEERDFAMYLENELNRRYGIKVPSIISNGLRLRVSVIFFQRRHIPNGIITNSLFPILYLDKDPMVAVMIPYKFWPPEFLQQWI